MSDIPEAYGLFVSQIERVMEAMNTDHPLTYLNETSLLLNTCKEEFIKKHDLQPLKDDVEFFLNNQAINRELTLNSKVKEDIETAIEYLDDDRGQDEYLYYNAPFEKKLTELRTKIRKFLANLMEEKFKDEINLS